jgi:hypothetical protein
MQFFSNNKWSQTKSLLRCKRRGSVRRIGPKSGYRFSDKSDAQSKGMARFAAPADGQFSEDRQ